MKILDLGCGPRKREGAIGLDRVPLPGVDVVHDLESFPYPFDDDAFDVVYAMSVLEHLNDFLGAMEEIHRVLKPGGRLVFETPHFSGLNSWTDPTHRQHFAIRSFAFFEPEFGKNYYTTARFRAAWLKVELHSPWRQLGVQRLVNLGMARPYRRGPRRFWEEHLAFLIRARGIHAELVAVKGGGACPAPGGGAGVGGAAGGDVGGEAGADVGGEAGAGLGRDAGAGGPLGPAAEAGR